MALAKGETRSDWMRRPLSPSQLEYAADDVRHLAALYQATGIRLRELGRQDWMIEDMERTLANAAVILLVVSILILTFTLFTGTREGRT